MYMIKSIVNLPILDEAGRDFSSKTGAPMIPLLDDILFNMILDDIDQQIEKQLPELHYARYQHMMLIPLSQIHHEYEVSIIHTLYKIFPECYLDPSRNRKYSRGNHIPLSNTRGTPQQRRKLCQ